MEIPHENHEQNGGDDESLAGASDAMLVSGEGQPSDAPPDLPPPMSEEDYAAYVGGLSPVKVDDDWRSRLMMVTRKNKETKEVFTVPHPTCQTNIYLMTRFGDALRGLFILNEFSRRKMLIKCPPWEKIDRFRPRDVEDDDYTRVAMELEKCGLVPERGKVIATIESICKDRSFHPVKKYFNSLRGKWDGVPRLAGALTTYFSAPGDESIGYLEAVFKKWMIAGVARIYQPGCQFSHMLVLEGPTDIGKSDALRRISTFHGEEYFYDGLTFSDLYDKDTMLKLQGNLILEFPEMTNMQNREIEEVKQWMTIREDKGRKPYGHEPVIFPRQFILAGTTENSEYLKDTSGNKRFWPVQCGKKIEMDMIVRDKEQLWAEAVHRYHAGEKWWIPADDALIGLTKIEQAKRVVKHPWTEDVLEFVWNKHTVSVREILDQKIKMPIERRKRSDEMAVAGILKMNGFKKTREGWERVAGNGNINIADLPEIT